MAPPSQGLEPPANPARFSDDVRSLAAPDLSRQAKKIREFVSKLHAVEGIPVSSIVVLIADRLKRKDYENALQRVPISVTLSWKELDNKVDSGVTVETVARFKGLESDVLIIWGLDDLPSEERRETLYVGISRAKAILALCGTEQSCADILDGL